MLLAITRKRHRSVSDASSRLILNVRDHGFLKFQRPLSFLGSNLVSDGVLTPTAVRARPGIALGIIRQVPSIEHKGSGFNSCNYYLTSAPGALRIGSHASQLTY